MTAPLPSTPTSWRSSWGVSTEELWDAWAFACVEAELALDAWKRAASGLKAAAFAAYRAALDREEQAATALASRIVPNEGKRLQFRRPHDRAA